MRRCPPVFKSSPDEIERTLFGFEYVTFSGNDVTGGILEQNRWGTLNPALDLRTPGAITNKNSKSNRTPGFSSCLVEKKTSGLLYDL